MYKSIITDQVDQDIEKALPIICNQGYSYIELHNVYGKSIEQLSNQEVLSLKRLIDHHGLQVSNIASTVFFLCPLYNEDQVSLFDQTFYSITGSVKEHLQYLQRACKIASKLSCQTIRIFPFRWPDNRKGPYGTNEDIKQIVDYLKLAADIAKANDVCLVLENCPYSHLPKGKMTLNVIKQIDSPNLRLLWDPANSYRAIKENVPQDYLQDDLNEELKQIYPYIRHIHIKDYHYDPSFQKPFLHKTVGDGDIDYEVLFSLLKTFGYDKAISLEPEVSFEQTLASMKYIDSII